VEEIIQKILHRCRKKEIMKASIVKFITPLRRTAQNQVILMVMSVRTISRLKTVIK
jgi:hypothetical protein